MKSIRTKILVVTLAILVAALGIAGIVSSYLNYSSTLDTLEQTMSETVKIASQRVAADLAGYKRLVEELARDAAEEGSIPQEECNEIAAANGFTSFSITDASGITLTGTSLSDRDYFQQCRDSLASTVSDPILRKDDGTMNIMVAAPIVSDGKFTGIACAGLDASFLCDIVRNIKIGSGNAAILSRSGDTIGFADEQLVLEAYNTQNEAKSDKRLVELAAIEARMCSGETGVGSYYYEGQNKFMAFAPVPDTNGWSMDVAVVRREFLQGTYTGIFIIVVLSVLMLAVSVVLVARLAGSISAPIHKCAERLQQLAQGDLKAPVPTVHKKDETGVLAASTRELVERLNTMLGDAGYLLGEMADGNFNVKTRAEESYVGDFESLKLSMRKINRRLSDTLAQINRAAEQVAGGSDQVSSGAQALSQGATEQASSVQELTATVSEISGQVRQTAQQAQEATSKTSVSADIMTQADEQMQQLQQAMGAISDSSGQISKIIKTIEDIAFQTNILALNAAVEAARAGAAGKGFAVVADEVRALANKSQEAVKNTAALIDNSLQAVEQGNALVGKAGELMAQVVEASQEVSGAVKNIDEAAGAQAVSIAQVTQGLDQISSVVQTNSATAEQSAAASEELSSQAQMLKDLVGRFKLRGDGQQASEEIPQPGSAPALPLGDTADKY